MWISRRHFEEARATSTLTAEVEAVKGILNTHLVECAARFASLQTMVLTASKIIIGLLLGIVGWLLVHFVFKGVPL